jgi:hypothetical protein
MVNRHYKGLDPLKVQRAAAKTRMMVEKLRLFVSAMRFPEPTPRKHLAAALLMASMEHAEAVAFLLEHGPRYHGMPAIALVRPQIECFLRGVFFHSEATSDQEVTNFIQRDELPKRSDADGRKRPISMAQMEDVTTQAFGEISKQLSKDPMPKLFAVSPKELHGLVHGGAEVLDLYRINGASLGFNASDQELLALLGSSGMIAGYAMSYLAARIAKDPGREPEALQEAHQAFQDEILAGRCLGRR